MEGRESKALADLGGVPGAHPLRVQSPDSFVLTYKIFETKPPRESTSPLRGPHPPTGNPGSATEKDQDFFSEPLGHQRSNKNGDLVTAKHKKKKKKRKRKRKEKKIIPNINIQKYSTVN